jgi:hypothetical protein
LSLLLIVVKSNEGRIEQWENLSKLRFLSVYAVSMNGSPGKKDRCLFSAPGAKARCGISEKTRRFLHRRIR